MHQEGWVGGELTVARNGDGRTLEGVVEEACVLKNIVGDLQILHIAALVPGLVNFRFDQDGRHADVADGAVVDRSVGRFEQEAAGTGGVHEAVVKQEARAVGGDVFNQCAGFDLNVLIQGENVDLPAARFGFGGDLRGGQKFAAAGEEDGGVSHLEVGGKALIVVVALGVGQLAGGGVVVRDLAELAADVGSVVGHLLKQAVDDLRSLAHVGAVGGVAGGEKRLGTAQTALVVGPDQVVAIFAGVKVFGQNGSRLGGDGHAVELGASVAVALLEAEARAADDAEILKADVAAAGQNDDAGAVAAHGDLAADLQLPASVACQDALMLAVAEIFDALEADIGKGHRLTRAEGLHIGGTGGIVGFIGQVGQITGVGLGDDVIVALFDDGRLSVGVVDVADVHAVDGDIGAVVHGEHVALVGFKFHRHAVGVDVVILHAGQGQGVGRIQAGRNDGIGIVPRRKVEVSLERLDLVLGAHGRLVGHTRKDFHIGLGQQLLIDAVFFADVGIKEVVAVGVGGIGRQDFTGDGVVLHQEIIHLLRRDAAGHGVFGQREAYAAGGGNGIDLIEQDDGVFAVEHADAAGDLIKGDKDVLQPVGDFHTAGDDVVLHHGFAAAELDGRALGGNRVVHQKRTGGIDVDDRPGVVRGIDDAAAGHRRSPRGRTAAVVMEGDRTAAERSVNPAADQAGFSALFTVDAVDGMVGHALDLSIFQGQSRAVPGVDNLLRRQVRSIPGADLQSKVFEGDGGGGPFHENREASFTQRVGAVVGIAARRGADADVLEIEHRLCTDSAEIEAQMIGHLIDGPLFEVARDDLLCQFLRRQGVGCGLGIVAAHEGEPIRLQAVAGGGVLTVGGGTLFDAGIVKIDGAVLDGRRDVEGVVPVVGALVYPEVNVLVLFHVQSDRFELGGPAVFHKDRGHQFADLAVARELHAVIAAVSRVACAGAVVQPDAALRIDFDFTRVRGFKGDDGVIHIAGHDNRSFVDLGNVVILHAGAPGPLIKAGNLGDVVFTDGRVEVPPAVFPLRGGGELLF